MRGQSPVVKNEKRHDPVEAQAQPREARAGVGAETGAVVEKVPGAVQSITERQPDGRVPQASQRQGKDNREGGGFYRERLPAGQRRTNIN